MQTELLYTTKATLGEGPIWDARTQMLYWLDILNKRIYAGGELLVELDEFIGCIAPRKNGGLVLTKRFSFWTFEPFDHTQGKSAHVQSALLLPLTDEPSNNRFNDGKCDPRGRFLAAAAG